MSRDDYAFPCGRCLCNHCANNVETIDNCTGEAKEPCFVCDECRWYDGDTRHNQSSERQNTTETEPEITETRKFVICPNCGEKIWL